MNCSICHNEFQDGDRITANMRQTFVFKPAHVQDPEVYQPDGKGGFSKINIAATMDPDRLREMRKDHVKTEIGKMFLAWGAEPLPKEAFGVRHLICDPQIVGRSGSLHPVMKHNIRFSRSMAKRGAH